MSTPPNLPPRPQFNGGRRNVPFSQPSQGSPTPPPTGNPISQPQQTPPQAPLGGAVRPSQPVTPHPVQQPPTQPNRAPHGFTQQQPVQPPINQMPQQWGQPQQNRQQPYQTNPASYGGGNRPGQATAPGKGNQARKKSSAGTIIFILLGVLILGGAGVTSMSLTEQVANQQEQITNQQEQIEQLERQKELLDEDNKTLQDKVDSKETFGAVTQSLFDELHYFDGTPTKELFRVDKYNSIIQGAYADREYPELVDAYTAQIQEELDRVKAEKASWEARKANVSGTSYEGTLDKISKGYADVTFYRASTNNICKMDASGCVSSAEPNMVKMNYDERDTAARWRGGAWGDWWFNGIIYHEFAHVLQFTNWTTTQEHLPVFNGDVELMADCYAITQYSADFAEYGYRKGCTPAQRAQIGKWLQAVTYQTPTIVQGEG